MKRTGQAGRVGTPEPAPPWHDSWFSQHTTDLAMAAWRGVEAQHIVSTMRLVDSLAEQDLLETLLETSKPALPAEAAQQHYLLSTPFRYRPRHASRFRRVGALGVWYGAASQRTACAEIACWRWRFLSDSTGLANTELLTEHTLFNAAVQGPALDLTAPPWSANAARWQHPSGYAATHALADAARTHAVQWLRYASVRDPGGLCAAVLAPQALRSIDLASQQTWHCRTTAHAVRLVHGADRFEWTFTPDPGSAEQ